MKVLYNVQNVFYIHISTVHAGFIKIIMFLWQHITTSLMNHYVITFTDNNLCSIILNIHYHEIYL